MSLGESFAHIPTTLQIFHLDLGHIILFTFIL
jgi:hypothetical protein